MQDNEGEQERSLQGSDEQKGLHPLSVSFTIKEGSVDHSI
jgi:hypothetical protein